MENTEHAGSDVAVEDGSVVANAALTLSQPLHAGRSLRSSAQVEMPPAAGLDE